MLRAHNRKILSSPQMRSARNKTSVDPRWWRYPRTYCHHPSRSQCCPSHRLSSALDLQEASFWTTPQGKTMFLSCRRWQQLEQWVQQGHDLIPPWPMQLTWSRTAPRVKLRPAWRSQLQFPPNQSFWAREPVMPPVILREPQPSFRSITEYPLRIQWAQSWKILDYTKYLFLRFVIEHITLK